MAGYPGVYYWTDQEPIVDELREIKRKEGLSDRQIMYLTRVSSAAMGDWWSRKTKAPRHATVEAFIRGLGYHRPIVKRKEMDFERELVRAETSFKEYQESRRKARARRANGRKARR